MSLYDKFTPPSVIYDNPGHNVASLWRIATLLLQWDKLVTVKKIYIHPASDTSDADNDLHDTYTEHVIFNFKSK
jgi:hypothetical protein